MCCPACLGAAVVYLAGATSAGGLAALALTPARRARQKRSRTAAGAPTADGAAAARERPRVAALPADDSAGSAAGRKRS